MVEGLTRELARARLSKDDPTDEFAKRFVIYFQSYAEAHSETTPEDFAALETEKDNVLNAIEVAYALGGWTDVMDTRSALEAFLDLHGHWEDAIRTGKQALRAARELTSASSIAYFAHNLGVLLQKHGELDESRMLYRESLEIRNRLGDQDNIAISLHQ